MLTGAVLPLGLLGLWLLRTASKAGEELLRQQLDETLAQIANQVGLRWEHRRSDLLLLAENDVVQQGLRAGLAGDGETDPAPRYLQQAYAAMQHTIDHVRYRDASGQLRWTLAPDAGQVLRLESAERASANVIPASAGVVVGLPITDDRTGAGLGTLEARVRLRSILPAGVEQVGPTGSVLSVSARRTGDFLLPIPFEPELLASEYFDRDGEPWLARRRSLAEPAIDLILAAPLGPYTLPFERRVRRGAVALVGVALLGFGMAAVLTRRLTRSLERLATAAGAVAGGDLDRKVEAYSRDEVGRVADAFNTMTESLRRTLADLSQREALAAVGEFATSLAHEVRNPLTAIRIDLQRVHEKLTQESRLREPLARALRSVERLNRTVSAALRVARSGRVRLEEVDLRAVLEAAVHGAEPEFLARKATVAGLSPDCGPLMVRGDAAALGQLFLNLLLNAAQSLETGGRAGVCVESSDGEFTVAVRDTGRGMTGEELTRVFEPFYSTRSEGTGLGLAIARRVATAHAGRIDIDSTPRHGTTVRVRLPAADTTTLPQLPLG